MFYLRRFLPCRQIMHACNSTRFSRREQAQQSTGLGLTSAGLANPNPYTCLFNNPQEMLEGLAGKQWYQTLNDLKNEGFILPV